MATIAETSSNGSSATPFQQTLPTWLLVVAGSLALVVMSGSRFYGMIVIFLVGVLAYRILNG